MVKKLRAFNFVKGYKITFTIAAVFIAAGLIGLILSIFGVNMFNFDIDFVGGTTMQFEMHQTVTSAISSDVAKITKDTSGIAPSSVTKAGDSGTQVVIRTKELDSETRDKVFAAVKAAYKLPDTDTPIKSDYVSASVGNDLKKSAVVASLLAVLLILVYITIRFEFRSGVAAVCALLHDLLTMLSMYVIFRIPFNMNFIAAALTILGYSINATIVVFDRVRENKKLNPKTPFGDVVNMSIHQTMSRSINTTLTTLFPIVLLLILGVSSIRNFAIPVTVGVICGCFSSVCISGPLWTMMEAKKKA